MYTYADLTVVLPSRLEMIFRARTNLLVYHTRPRKLRTPPPGTPRILLLLGSCRRDRLGEVKVGLGVCELLDLLDLQVPVLIGNYVPDENRFTIHLNPDQGFRLIGDLWDKLHVRRTRRRSEHLGYRRGR